MLGGFDCDTLPRVAEFLYGDKRDLICNSAHYMGQFDDSFDLFGEMFWIGGAVLITALAARMPVVAQPEEDRNQPVGMQSCPKCQGTGRFLSQTCDLCDGDGSIDSDSRAFLLPRRVSARAAPEMPRYAKDRDASDAGDSAEDDEMGGFDSPPSAKDRDNDDF